MAKTKGKPAETRSQGMLKMMGPLLMQMRSFSYKPVKPLLPFPRIRMENYNNSHGFIWDIRKHQPTFGEVEDEEKKKELQVELDRENGYLELAQEALKTYGTEALRFVKLARESKKRSKDLEKQCNDRAEFKEFWQGQ